MKNLIPTFAALLGAFLPASSAQAQIFVASYNGNTISEYDSSGATINSSFISGVTNPTSMVAYGDSFYVTSNNGYAFGEVGQLTVYPATGGSSHQVLLSNQNMPSQASVYGGSLYLDTASGGTNTLTSFPINGTSIGSGTVISSNLPGGGSSFAITPDGNNVLVPDFYFGRIDQFSMTGGTSTTGFITGLNFPFALTFSGNNLFVLGDTADASSQVVVEYTIDGDVISAGTTIVTGLHNAGGIAASGNQVYVTTNNTSTTDGGVSEFTVSDDTVVSQNLSFITGLNTPGYIYVAATSTPEPQSLPLLGLGFVGLFLLGRMTRNKIRL